MYLNSSLEHVSSFSVYCCQICRIVYNNTYIDYRQNNTYIDHDLITLVMCEFVIVFPFFLLRAKDDRFFSLSFSLFLSSPFFSFFSFFSFFFLSLSL